MRLRVVGPISLAVSILGSLLVRSRLPERVPIHWNIHGQADDWASPTVAVAWGPGVVLGMWLLFEVLPRIDPRRKDLQGGGRETVLSLSLAMIAGIHLAYLARITGLASDERPIFLVLGIFFVVLGNYLGKVKPNWFAGIRTPWTLENDEVWHRTQRVAGRAFVVAGIGTVIGSLVLKGAVFAALFATLVIAASIGPAIYSFVIYRRLGRTGG